MVGILERARSLGMSLIGVGCAVLLALGTAQPADAGQDFYQANEGRSPRWLLTRAFELLRDGGVKPTIAVDAGYGNGIETLWLLERGLKVYAHDISADARTSLLRRVPKALRQRLHLEVAAFHEATWPTNSDLVFAGLSLPFAPPAEFRLAWHKLESSLACGGRFAGHLFGDRDSWAVGPQAMDGTFLSETEARALFRAQFEVEFFETEDRDGDTAAGAQKHWHVFHIIARKVCPEPGAAGN
jgi:tellurite methyltransferase